MRSREEVINAFVNMAGHKPEDNLSGEAAELKVVSAALGQALLVLLDIRDLLMQAPTVGTGGPDVELVKDEGDGDGTPD